jgi:uncharacterized membrane protein YqiK
MSTQTDDLAVLEQKRQQLSLDALEGREGAAQELEEVESRIDGLKREEERRALADKERQARAEAEARAREAEQRAEMQAQLAELWRQRGPIAGEIEQAVEALGSALSRLFLIGDETVRLVYALTGRQNHRLDLRDATLGFLRWKLPELGLPRAHPAYRQPLTAILNQVAEPSGQAPAEEPPA